MAVACLCAPLPALAHPHVFAEARLEVTTKPDGTIDRLQNVWRFDDVFSSTVLLEFDANANGELDESELESVAATVTESTSEFDYFLTISVGDKNVSVQPVTDMKALFDAGQLLLLFTATPKEAVKLADGPHIGVYDPTFYTALDFADDSAMALIGAPTSCGFKMVVPDPDEAMAQNEDTLTEAFWETTGADDFAKLLATRMEVSCG